MARFNPFPKLDCRYGAPMGRTVRGTISAALSGSLCHARKASMIAAARIGAVAV